MMAPYPVVSSTLSDSNNSNGTAVWGRQTIARFGVFANLCRDSMASLIDAHLYSPEHWANDSDRCNKAAVPERYQSKCEIALSMIETALQHGVRFGYVAIDTGYGKDAAFLRGVDNLGCTFVADVHPMLEHLSGIDVF